jgi:hypothetical protein
MERLDDLYLPWLYSQVGHRSVKERNPSRTHWRLLRQLYSIEFVYVIDRDDNRAEDGRALRYEWADEVNFRVDPIWLEHGCSFLEMLIALSRRLAFEANGEPHLWFWHLLNNLNLTDCNDRSNYDVHKVDDIVDTVIWRTFDRNGNGGLFPMRRARRDQRNVEIWTQMHEYLLTT